MNLIDIVKQFPERKIVVLGDIMLDKTVIGSVKGSSPEAVNALDVQAEEEIFSLGGAGNVAANIASLGGKVSLFGFVGEDTDGLAIRYLCERANILREFDVCNRTTTKFRVRGRNEKESQQMIRISYEDRTPKSFSEEMTQRLLAKVEEADMVLLSDYAKGAITPQIMATLRKYADKIIVDPKPVNIDNYCGMFLVKSNKKEARAIAQKESIEECGEQLVEKLGTNILITLDKDGMRFFPRENPKQSILIPTYAKDICDVTGAGDTANATLGLSLAVNRNYQDAMILANHAAGIAVEKVGTYAVSARELEERIIGKRNKRVGLEELTLLCETAKKMDKKVVFTSGCYDILHPGHTQFLQAARALGDILILALNGDKSPFFKNKGGDRPILKENERIEVLSCLEPVTYIIVFNDDSPVELIRTLKPDVKVKGGTYIPERTLEEDLIVKSYGGECKYIEMVGKYSTTSLINQIRNNK